MSWGWQESYEMDGLASCLRKIFHNRRNHAVVNIGRQVKGTLVHLFLGFFVIFSLYAVLSGTSVQRNFNVSSKSGTALHQPIVLERKDLSLAENHGLFG